MGSNGESVGLRPEHSVPMHQVGGGGGLLHQGRWEVKKGGARARPHTEAP